MGAAEADTLAALAADHAEIRVAAHRLLGHGRSDELAAACTSALLFWLVRGHLTELGRLAAAGLSDAESALARARWHYLAGWAVLPRGRFTEASEHFAGAVRSARRRCRDGGGLGAGGRRLRGRVRRRP